MGTIRGLEQADWDDWRALWGGYLAFYRAQLSDETSRATFERLCAGGEGMFGLLALDDAGRGIGMANCVVHASTWSRQPKTYLEDLFVAPTARGHDVGRALLEAVKQAGAERGRRASTGTPSSTTGGPARSTTWSGSRPRSSSTRCSRARSADAPVTAVPYGVGHVSPVLRTTTPPRAGR